MQLGWFLMANGKANKAKRRLPAVKFKSWRAAEKVEDRIREGSLPSRSLPGSPSLRHSVSLQAKEKPEVRVKVPGDRRTEAAGPRHSSPRPKKRKSRLTESRQGPEALGASGARPRNYAPPRSPQPPRLPPPPPSPQRGPALSRAHPARRRRRKRAVLGGKPAEGRRRRGGGGRSAARSWPTPCGGAGRPRGPSRGLPRGPAPNSALGSLGGARRGGAVAGSRASTVEAAKMVSPPTRYLVFFQYFGTKYR